MTPKNKAAAILAAFLYAQGLLGFAAVSAAVMRNAPWPTTASGYGVDISAELAR
jgi:hypothetical protein